MRRALTALGVIALAAAVVVGLSQAGDESTEELPRFDLAEAREQLAGAPPPLAALHAQAADLLDGGLPAFRRRVRALRGTPIVVNKWASWCGPCRSEFPIFQHAATRLGKRIAFLGVAAKDGPGPAARFLERFPVPYPSYEDPGIDISAHLKAALAWPTTIFLDGQGRIAYIKPGEYKSLADLEADIERYL